MASRVQAADVLLAGGVIAYPTEGVFGLGCLPDDPDAVARLLEIKQRSPAKGLILIAASPAQLAGWVHDDDLARMPPPEAGRPVTWIARPTPRVPAIVRGEHDSLAVRITTHRVAAEICDAVGMPVVSTSANVSGRPVARNQFVLRRNFGRLVDFVVPGDCGPASGASEIRRLDTGEVLRPGRP